MFKKITLLLILICFFAGLCGSPAYVYADDANEKLNLLTRQWEQRKLSLGLDHPDTLTSLHDLARVYFELGNYQKSLELCQQVFEAQKRVLGLDHPNTLRSLNGLAVAYMQLGDHQKSLKLLQEVVEAQKRVLGPDHPNTLRSLNNLAVVYKELGDYQKSLELNQQVAEASKRVLGPDHPDTLTSLNNFAIDYKKLGDYQKSLELNQQVFEVRKRVLGPDHPDTLSSVNNLAGIYGELGDYQKSLELCQQAFEASKRVLGPDHPNTLTSLNSLTGAYFKLGDYQKSLKLFQQVFETRKRVLGPDHPETLRSLNNLALVYEYLGDYQQSLKLFQQVFEARKRVLAPDHPDTLQSLTNLAEIYWDLGEYQKGLKLNQQVAEASKRILGPDHPDTLIWIHNLATAYYSLGDYQKGLKLNQQVAEASKRVLGPDHPDTLRSLINLAGTYRHLGEFKKALEYTQQAFMGFSQKLGIYHPMTAHSAMTLAQTLYNSNQLESAIFYARLAVIATQRQRQSQSQQSLDEELQKSYLAKVEDRYQMLAAWLLQAGRSEAALEVLRLLKADEFSDLSGKEAAAPKATSKPAQNTDRSLIDPLQKKLEQLGAALNEADTTLAELGKKEKASALNSEETKAKVQAETTLTQTQKDFQHFMAQLLTELAQEDRADPYPEAGRRNLAALQEIIQKMGEGTVIIHTLNARDALHLFLTTKDGLVLRQSPVGLKAMEEKVAALQPLLRSPSLDPRPAAQAIYRAVLEPLEADLTGAKTLMFSVDGALRYIPLAALYDGEQWLPEKYAVVMFTEAARDKLTPKTNFTVQAAALGLTEAKDGLAALPAVEEELNDVVKVKGEKTGVLPGVRFLNGQFNYKTLSASLKQGRGVLHLASHFIFRPQVPNMSYLLLGDGSKLTIMDISRDDQLPFNKVDMLTLSACETAAGLARGNGREVEGLAALAQMRGAATVLATLWPIADESTGRLMSDFYRLRFDEKMTKAEALRQAQLNLMHGRAAEPAGQAQTRGKATVAPVSSLMKEDQAAAVQPWTGETYAHPYFWAPFILMGNWK
jgi:CHAT domain-containing protein